MRFVAAEALAFLNRPMNKFRGINFEHVGLVAERAQFLARGAQLLGERRDVALRTFPIKIGIVEELAWLRRQRGLSRRRERVCRSGRRRNRRGGWDHHWIDTVNPFKEEGKPLVFRRRRAAGERQQAAHRYRCPTERC